MEAHKTTVSMKKKPSKGAWSNEEDRKLAEAIAINGARRWKSIAIKAGLNRCGKSCRLRWMNYLRPNIKRGNISDQEEDLILRLHKLLGNRWSLIAGRLPGRTDNEIKNYWNSHLSKKLVQIEKTSREELSISKLPSSNINPDKEAHHENTREKNNNRSESNDSSIDNSFDVDDLFDFSASSFPSYDWFSEILLPKESV